jgi:hypothetical protein
MITLAAEDLEEVYPVPPKFLMDFRSMFHVSTHKCARRNDYSRSAEHLKCVSSQSVNDADMLAYIQRKSLDFLVVATLRSYRCKTPGTYEIFFPLDLVYLKYMAIDEDTDGLYVLPESLAVKRVHDQTS